MRGVANDTEPSDVPRPELEEEIPLAPLQPRIVSIFDIPGMRSDWRWPVCAAIAVAVLYGGSSLNVDDRVLAPLVFTPLLVGGFFLFGKMARDYAALQAMRRGDPGAPRLKVSGMGNGQRAVALVIIGVGVVLGIVVSLHRLGVP